MGRPGEDDEARAVHLFGVAALAGAARPSLLAFCGHRRWTKLPRGAKDLICDLAADLGRLDGCGAARTRASRPSRVELRGP